MNMFRNLFAAALFIFALGLAFGDPDKWTWVDLGGATVVDAFRVCVQFRPFVIAGCIVVAVALFLTRKQY
jgi:hypothetical protein